MDVRLKFYISLVELCDFSLPKLADSKWICWNNKQQVINNLWFGGCFSSIDHCHLFFLASEMKTEDFNISKNLSFSPLYLCSTFCLSNIFCYGSAHSPQKYISFPSVQIAFFKCDVFSLWITLTWLIAFHTF